MELDNARGWRPEEGNVLVGEVVSVEKGWTEEGEKFYPIVTLKPEGKVRVAKQDADGKTTDEFETIELPIIAVHCFHAVLYARVVELRPEPGERIGIKFVKATEKKKGEKKSTASVYNVKVDGRAAANVWDVMEVDERAAKAANKQQEILSMGRTTHAEVMDALPEVTTTEGDEEIPF